MLHVRLVGPLVVVAVVILSGCSKTHVTAPPNIVAVDVPRTPRGCHSFVFAGTDRGVFRSNDSGASWEEMSGPLKGVAIRALAVADHSLFVGTAADGVWEFQSTR